MGKGKEGTEEEQKGDSKDVGTPAWKGSVLHEGTKSRKLEFDRYKPQESCKRKRGEEEGEVMLISSDPPCCSPPFSLCSDNRSKPRSVA